LVVISLLSVFTGTDGIVVDLSPINQQIILDIRLPRTITALVCGAALALAGVLLQALLNNPLAEPYILGVSGGGSVAALLSIVLGLTGATIIIGSFAGAFLSLILVYFISNKKQSGFAFRLILSGIILSAAWGAIINFILIYSPSSKLPSMLFWLMGDLSSFNIPWTTILILCCSLIISLGLSKDINLLLLGENSAQSLGLSIRKIQWFLLITSSLLVASVVSIAGNIGFVGLVIPHLIRLLGVHNHQSLIPLAAIFGAIMLITADWIARIIIAPSILPVGIVTTIIGAPIFIFLLRKSHA